jgi:HD-GYP domain-containing protein (c-di-GMP phosphodiesterase class II)
MASPTTKEIQRQANTLVKLRELQEQLALTRTATICALAQLLDLKDFNTGCHSTRLAEWAVRVARAMGMDEEIVDDVEVAAILHDIGKVGIDDAILRKPGKLTDDERAMMRRHPEFGWSILRVFPDFEQAALFVLHHHENFDGTGYPGGLAANEIPQGSRIVSLIDAYDAMVSSRPYRKGLPFEEANRRILEASGTQFDPDVVFQFIHIATPQTLGNKPNLRYVTASV